MGWNWALQSITHVGETDAEARKQLPYARWQNRAGRALNRLEVVDGRVQVGPYEGELDDDGFMERLYFGSPDTVIKKFAAAAELGVTNVSNWIDVRWPGAREDYEVHPPHG